MHRRLQFDMRENTASNRRHDSGAVTQRSKLHTQDETSSPHMGTADRSHEAHTEKAIAEGFATGDKEEINAAYARTVRKPGGSIGPILGGQARYILNDSEFEPLLDVAEAARLLRIHPKTLRVKAGRGIIPGIQIGRAWRFRASMLNRWLEGMTDRS